MTNEYSYICSSHESLDVSKFRDAQTMTSVSQHTPPTAHRCHLLWAKLVAHAGMDDDIAAKVVVAASFAGDILNFARAFVEFGAPS